MKDRRIKTYWWKSIHQYKGELLPPYRLLSFPSFLNSFSPHPPGGREKKAGKNVDSR